MPSRRRRPKEVPVDVKRHSRRLIADSLRRNGDIFPELEGLLITEARGREANSRGITGALNRLVEFEMDTSNPQMARLLMRLPGQRRTASLGLIQWKGTKGNRIVRRNIREHAWPIASLFDLEPTPKGRFLPGFEPTEEDVEEAKRRAGI